MNKIQQDKQEMENLKYEAERAEREGDYGKVAEIRYSKLKALEDENRRLKKLLAESMLDVSALKDLLGKN